MTAKTTLSPIRQRFVDHLASNGGNGAKAYRDAGYAAPNVHTAANGASRLLAIAGIRNAVDAKRAHIQAASDISRTDVITGLHKIACTEDEPASARVAAWRHIGDILGLVTRKVDVTRHDTGLRDDLTAMTLAEVLTLRDELVRALPGPGILTVDGHELPPAGVTDSAGSP